MFDNNNENDDLIDYKFFCFNGVPKFCQVIRGRNTNESIDFYDMNWVHQDFVGLNVECKNGVTPIKKPENLDKMIDISKKLSVGIPFVRVDLYLINGIIYFGELTFYPGSGFGSFQPKKWDYILGEFIKLPINK